MTVDEPRPAELSRRIDDVGREVKNLRTEMGNRFDRMPTTDIMLAYLATRDLEMKTLSEDVKELVASQAQERAERRAAIEAEKNARETQFKEQSDKRDSDRKWALTFALGSVAAFIALVGVFVNAGGLG